MTDWLEIPETVIRLETGNRHRVAPFSVSRLPIVVSEFRRFCRDSGYVTTAHRLAMPETFERNATLDKLQKMRPATRKRLELPQDLDTEAIAVKHVSQEDAVAYCRHASARLPTEAEWLAAAVLNWDERFDDFGPALRRYRSHPRAIRWELGAEWTADVIEPSGPEGGAAGRRLLLSVSSMRVTGYKGTSEKWAVLRAGPIYMLPRKWEQSPLGYIAPVDFSSALTGFRICRLR